MAAATSSVRTGTIAGTVRHSAGVSGAGRAGAGTSGVDLLSQGRFAPASVRGGRAERHSDSAVDHQTAVRLSVGYAAVVRVPPPLLPGPVGRAGCLCLDGAGNLGGHPVQGGSVRHGGFVGGGGQRRGRRRHCGGASAPRAAGTGRQSAESLLGHVGAWRTGERVLFRVAAGEHDAAAGVPHHRVVPAGGRAGAVAHFVASGAAAVGVLSGAVRGAVAEHALVGHRLFLLPHQRAALSAGVSGSSEEAAHQGGAALEHHRQRAARPDTAAADHPRQPTPGHPGCGVCPGRCCHTHRARPGGLHAHVGAGGAAVPARRRERRIRHPDVAEQCQRHGRHRAGCAVHTAVRRHRDALR
eukprot:ctg_1091.g342